MHHQPNEDLDPQQKPPCSQEGYVECGVIDTIESVRSLWELLPQTITIVVGGAPRVKLDSQRLFKEEHPLIQNIVKLLEQLGKEVRFEQIGDDKSTYLDLDIQGDVMCVTYGGGENIKSVSSFERFNDDECRLIASAHMHQKNPAERGLIGAGETGHIRNTYLLFGDGLLSQTTDDYAAYVRSLSNGMSASYKIKGLSLQQQFLGVAQALKGHFDPKEIIVYEGHFFDHIRYDVLSADLTPQKLLSQLAEIFPEATGRTIEVSERAQSDKASYGKYSFSHPEVNECTQMYQDGEKRIVIYDRHAWGIFSGCPRGELPEDTWYYDPRSTGTTLLLQLPYENLEGSLLTYALTPEAQAIYHAAGLTRPYSQEEWMLLAAGALSGIARSWLSERESM